MLLGVRIQNFDCFSDHQVGLLLEESIGFVGSKERGIRLRNLNALIGRNNTGKSSFIRSMSYIKRCILDDVAQASTADGRPGFMNLVIDKEKPSIFTLFFKLKDVGPGSLYLEYKLTVGATKFGSPYVKDETVLLSKRNDNEVTTEVILHNYPEKRLVNDERITALSVLGRINNGNKTEINLLYEEIDKWFFCQFSTYDTPDYYALGNAPGGHKHLNSAGSNLGNVLTYLKSLDGNVYEHIVNEINSKIPVMKLKSSMPESLEGSPEKLFKYLLLLRDQEPKSTIFIETPDKDLYHDMVDVLAIEMRQFTLDHRYSQIVFSTHNPYIVESMPPKEIWVFSRDFDTDEIEIKCAGSNPVVNELFNEGIGMGAIWYGGHLDEN
ncbi:MAG: hypothetical protein MJ094_02785 [Saccharofermentans sp.]|nr:hypothetical protein [Saccharofermentans sp.]